MRFTEPRPGRPGCPFAGSFPGSSRFGRVWEPRVPVGSRAHLRIRGIHAGLGRWLLAGQDRTHQRAVRPHHRTGRHAVGHPDNDRSHRLDTSTNDDRPSGPQDLLPAERAGPCTTDKLKITAAQGGAASGHKSVTIALRNVGRTECRISGYPGVDGATSSGHQVQPALRTRLAYLGGQDVKGIHFTGPPDVIRLVPKEVASALVEGTSSSPSGQTCGSFIALLVTPPGETHSVTITVAVPALSRIQVHPVVPGPSGSS